MTGGARGVILFGNPYISMPGDRNTAKGALMGL